MQGLQSDFDIESGFITQCNERTLRRLWMSGESSSLMHAQRLVVEDPSCTIPAVILPALTVDELKRYVTVRGYNLKYDPEVTVNDPAMLLYHAETTDDTDIAFTCYSDFIHMNRSVDALRALIPHLDDALRRVVFIDDDVYEIIVNTPTAALIEALRDFEGDSLTVDIFRNIDIVEIIKTMYANEVESHEVLRMYEMYPEEFLQSYEETEDEVGRYWDYLEVIVRLVNDGHKVSVYPSGISESSRIFERSTSRPTTATVMHGFTLTDNDVSLLIRNYDNQQFMDQSLLISLLSSAASSSTDPEVYLRLAAYTIPRPLDQLEALRLSSSGLSYAQSQGPHFIRALEDAGIDID